MIILQNNPFASSKGSIYTFHETVTSAGTTTIDGIEYKIVYFGDWPQTIKSDDVTIDETKTVTIGGNTYYFGSDNNYYAKCAENANQSGYTYSDGTKVAKSSINSTKYFKVEPIKWRVLTENYNSSGKTLLLAENILTANVPYYGSKEWRTLNGTEIYIYPNNYKYSNIRSYLNGTQNQFVVDGGAASYFDDDWTNKGFLQSAFTTSAQSLIEPTSVDNSAASTTDSEGKLTQATSYVCGNTSDKIFLLSEKEATTTDYGFAACNADGIGNARIRVATDYAKANCAYQSAAIGLGGWWWLRSPRYDGNLRAQEVYLDGYADYYNYVSSMNVGVVPALTISLE